MNRARPGQLLEFKCNLTNEFYEQVEQCLSRLANYDARKPYCVPFIFFNLLVYSSVD